MQGEVQPRGKMYGTRTRIWADHDLGDRRDCRNSDRLHISASRILGAFQMTHEYKIVIERDADGYYVASVQQLHGCHTQAKTLDELMARIQEAIELCLEATAA